MRPRGRAARCFLNHVLNQVFEERVKGRR
jgi:hypothetical protein